MISILPIKSNSDNNVDVSGACVGCQSNEPFEIEFEYAYQPIVNFSTRSIVAYEALVRGPNGESAASILAQINDHNRYRFDQLCRMKAVEGAAKLGMTEFLSINFLPNAVYRPEVCIRTTLEAARKYNFPVEKIIFEVTEGERVQDRPHLVHIIREYRNFGFQTAIDDFGAGYAGLNLLSEYQPDFVKIDMDLVRGVDHHLPRQAIVEGITSICKKLNIKVLAEGIETRAERDFLFASGIELMQGYWFSKPVFKGLGNIDPSAWE
ncbi:EAL domain-containing protein (putative c-di-GMP-specific phosphodiesterase class I) [Undibacterium sp. GrIS 1.2]|uniref:EAL domain-containing protein n=1 Tax=Undibacterium sp. GrIS 1.2 TaxID=3143933 RepID=UPI00339B2FCF